MRLRVSGRGVLLFLLLAIAAGAAALAAGPAAAKSFSIPSVDIKAQVEPSGDLRVREVRTLQFDGSFSLVYWDLSTKGSKGIEVTGASGPTIDGSGSEAYKATDDPSARQPGTYFVSDLGGKLRVQLFFSVYDTTSQFSIEYTAKSAAKRWADTAELYWQFVGNEADIPAGDVRVAVRLPKGVKRDDVRAWAHGPLWGDVAIEPDAGVVMTVSPLPATTFVEGRILFPAAALSKAPVVATPRLDSVLAEEQQLADEANRSRLWARFKVIAWSVVGVGAPLLVLVLVLWLYVKYGREPKPDFKGQYLRDEPQPALPPALAGFIWRMGSIGRDDVTATLLDLVNRKVIDLERVTVHKKRMFGKDDTETYKLTLHDERLDELLPYERDLAKFLFHEIAGGSSLVLSELKELAKKKRTTFAKGYKDWMEMVKSEAKRRQYLDKTADQMAFVGASLGFVGAVAAGAAAVFSGGYWFFLGVPVCFGLTFVARAIKRRSKEAAELHAQYEALERYLKDFGRLQEKPPDAVVLWEHFLVYAVVFGIADKVIKAMTVKVPEVVDDPAFRTSYVIWFATPHGGGMSAFSEMHQSFGQAVSVATSSSSSGSGGGGGFSGGGGGGGGGGGFGAN
jgi:uncharacterized membrane protein